jgi:uncharacterized protein involved in exopolysaccharide biosynthesis
MLDMQKIETAVSKYEKLLERNSEKIRALQEENAEYDARIAKFKKLKKAFDDLEKKHEAELDELLKDEPAKSKKKSKKVEQSLQQAAESAGTQSSTGGLNELFKQ